MLVSESIENFLKPKSELYSSWINTNEGLAQILWNKFKFDVSYIRDEEYEEKTIHTHYSISQRKYNQIRKWFLENTNFDVYDYFNYGELLGGGYISLRPKNQKIKKPYNPFFI